MNRQFIWQDYYKIGVPDIDREHKKLFSIMNKLFAFSEDETKSQWVCQEGIKYFKEHALKHFAEEEVYMATIGYSGYEMHRRLHDTFRKKTLPEIEAELKQTNYSQDAIQHFLSVCGGWLIGHTLTEDRAITGKTISKWAGLLPEESQAAMEQLIIELLDEMFQLNARLISDSYNGEKFGNGIYYRLVYVSKAGKTWEVILIFEEKLLVKTLGKIMRSGSEKLDVMLMNATRYTAQQFAERITLHFPSSELFEVKEENLLTYDVFEKLFSRQAPQSSLLFDTGKGYFAFCVMAPHLLKESPISAIKPENATAEIRKYLSKNRASVKKKILVVDDSNVMRHSIQELLSKKYEITMANSGLSAIRSMVLDRPDLVLLDYEMPVCDGRQVLEMIRSEEELADTPVIFLTSKVDKESVSKVIALKPAGYLSKSMKPEDIKENIDKFFQRKNS